MGLDGAGWMGMDGAGWGWMGMDGDGWGWGHRTAFGLEVGDAVHDDVVQEEGFVVHLDAAGQQPAEVVDVPVGRGQGGEVGGCAAALAPPLAQPRGESRAVDTPQDSPPLGGLAHRHHLVLVETLHGKPVQSLVGAAGTRRR